VGKKTGKNPTDRGKVGVKRSTLIDGRGVPLAVAVEGANVPDQRLVAATLDAIPVQRPDSTPEEPQHLCLDKGYVGKPVDREVRRRGYYASCSLQGQRSPEAQASSRQGSAVESRTHSFLAQPCPAATHPLGEKGHQLPGLPAPSIRHRRLTTRKGSRIGS